MAGETAITQRNIEQLWEARERAVVACTTNLCKLMCATVSLGENARTCKCKFFLGTSSPPLPPPSALLWPRASRSVVVIDLLSVDCTYTHTPRRGSLVVAKFRTCVCEIIWWTDWMFSSLFDDKSAAPISMNLCALLLFNDTWHEWKTRWCQINYVCSK